MPSGYPAAIDNFTDPTAVNNLSDASVLHSSLHTNVNDAINAIETELGLTPRGTALSVAARLSSIDTALTARSLLADEGVANGIATLDGAQKLVQSLDAAKISSGTIDVARVPNLSGAKILGTGSGGVAIPVDAVPSLDAGKTTTGTFNAARVPGLDGAKITTGTIAAARLPVSVTANANAKRVADVAARDAIPLVDRTDGMIVWTTSPNAIFSWRTDSSKWHMINYRTVLVSSYSTNTLATYTNVTGLSFPAEAGMTYGIRCELFIDNPGANAADLRSGWSFPAGEMNSAQMGLDINVVAPKYNDPWTAHAIVGATASPMDEGTGLGTPLAVPVGALLIATYFCTTAGVVQLRFRQDAASGTPSRVLKGSRMTVEGY